MAITTILGTDNIGSSRTTINDNFADLDTTKLDNSLTKAELNTAVTDGDVAFLNSANTFTASQTIKGSVTTGSGIVQLVDGSTFNRGMELISPNSTGTKASIRVINSNSNLTIGTRDFQNAIEISGADGSLTVNGTTRNVTNGSTKNTIETTLATGNYTTAGLILKTPTRISEFGMRNSTALDVPDSMFVFHNGAMRQVWDSNGNVGIGTTSPGAKLDIGASSGDILALNGTGTNNTLVNFQNDGVSKASIFTDNTNNILQIRSEGGGVRMYDSNFTGDIIGIDNGGNHFITGLPISSAGLASGRLFTQTATQLGGSGTTKVICVV